MQLDKNRISPGSKNWISFFFHLHQQGELNIGFKFKSHSLEDCLHYIFNQTGLLYGYPVSNLYSPEKYVSHLTSEEKLKLLLFENLFFTYNYYHSNEDDVYESFITSLASFYEHYGSKISLWNLTFDQNKKIKIEKIINERVKLKSKIGDGRYWLNQSSNGLVFVDVLLYSTFLKEDHFDAKSLHENIVFNVLFHMTKSAQIDGVIEEKEMRLLMYLLQSSNLDEGIKQQLEAYIRNTLDENIEIKYPSNLLHRKFIFELCVYLNYGTHQVKPDEERKLREIGKHLNLNPSEVEEASLFSRTFILKNRSNLSIINQDKSLSVFYKNIQSKWTRILGRNKEKIVSELKESKEFMDLLSKSTVKDLSNDEKELMKKQFYDILKTMPSLAIFLLPGGALLLPMISKLFPEMLPTSFQENTIDDFEDSEK
ncbi:LETM1 domain-containing protein [Crocinitomicaceae bacterium]|nr:LETM1 domain-containing protein [Crocinitomicaceae bacterium]